MAPASSSCSFSSVPGGHPDPPDEASPRGPLGWLAGMCAMLFVALLPFSSYAVVLASVQKEWGLGNAYAAALFSAYLVGLAFASLLVVPLTDRHPAESFVIAGVVLLAVSNFLFPRLAAGPLSAAALRFVAGCGHVSVYFPAVRLVAQRFEGHRRGAAVASFVGAGYLGTTLSYAVTGAFLEATGSWREAYGLTAALGLAAIPLASVLCRRAHRRRPDPSPPDSRPKGVLSAKPLGERSLVLVIAAYALHSAELYLARLWIPLLLVAFLVREGWDVTAANARAASIAGLMFTAGVAGVFLGGIFSDRVGRTAAAAVLFTVSGVCSFAIGWLLDAPAVLLFSVGTVYGFAAAADSAIYATALTELAPPGLLGSALAIQSFVGFLAGALAPVVAGSILDVLPKDDGWGIAFGLNGLLAVAGVSALIALRRRPEAAVMAAGRR